MTTADFVAFLKTLLMLAPELITTIMTALDKIGWDATTVDQLKAEIQDYHDNVLMVDKKIDDQIANDPGLAGDPPVDPTNG